SRSLGSANWPVRNGVTNATNDPWNVVWLMASSPRPPGPCVAVIVAFFTDEVKARRVSGDGHRHRVGRPALVGARAGVLRGDGVAIGAGRHVAIGEGGARRAHRAHALQRLAAAGAVD